MGRPPAMRLEDSDCKYPEIDVIQDQKEGELGCMFWLCLFFKFLTLYPSPRLEIPIHGQIPPLDNQTRLQPWELDV